MCLDGTNDTPLVIEDTVLRSKSTTLREGDRRPGTPVNRARGAEQSKSDGNDEGGLGEHGDICKLRERQICLSVFECVDCVKFRISLPAIYALASLVDLRRWAREGGRSDAGREARRMG